MINKIYLFDSHSISAIIQPLSLNYSGCGIVIKLIGQAILVDIFSNKNSGNYYSIKMSYEA